MDPIADMLTIIRNALVLGKPEVIVPYSGLKLEIAELLAKKEFVEGTSIVENEDSQKKEIKIELKYYSDGKPAISSIKRVSKPGFRVYVRVNNIPKPRGGFGVVVVSTPHGIMTGQDAKRRKTGGEVLCEVLS
ncbi:30S ribosomal protein S8 [Candidatus Berkelbacteria bacterium]|nr:30S ribosomal protein S8 [Candidatus Berkelbacteria bacterium]